MELYCRLLLSTLREKLCSDNTIIRPDRAGLLSHLSSPINHLSIITSLIKLIKKDIIHNWEKEY